MSECTERGCRHLETKCADCGRLVIDRVLPSHEWVSVKERMPEYNVNVLYTNGFDILLGWFEKPSYLIHSEGYWMTEDNGQYEDITHWMPLPEPPKD